MATVSTDYRMPRGQLPFMILPKPPSLRELEAHTPRISAVPEGIDRPFWSVMIPTYNSGDYLRRTLESVLCQDPGPDKMQIEVVDGSSTSDDPGRITQEIGKGRVAFHRLSSNQGPAHTFNMCIERSRGHWLHILHGDDLVLPGFYEAYADVIRGHPQVQMVVGQDIRIDENGRYTGITGPRPPVGGGILKDFTEQQATSWLVTCPTVVVRRSAYENQGGFCTLFQSVTDWDMWFRIGQHAPVACVARPYALYRVHSASETKRLMVSGANIQEAYFIVTTNLGRLGVGARALEEKTWRTEWAARAESGAWQMDRRQCFEGRYNQARWAWMLDRNLRTSTILVKSWLKHRLNSIKTLVHEYCSPDNH